jgi:hypothetical protein
MVKHNIGFFNLTVMTMEIEKQANKSATVIYVNIFRILFNGFIDGIQHSVQHNVNGNIKI